MTIDHDGNFPLARVLWPARLRPAVAVIDDFVRVGADITDDIGRTPEARHQALSTFSAGLDAIAAQQRPNPSGTLFDRLDEVVRTHNVPLAPFYTLVAAFGQDIDVTRYSDFNALREYTRRAANPVGHILLHLVKAATPENLRDADRICSALLLIHFWRDVPLDLRKGRIYLPRDDRERYHVSEAAIAQGRCDDPWRGLMKQQLIRVRALMADGGDLAQRLPGSVGWELRLVMHGALRTLERIEMSGCDVFRQRPTLTRLDWLAVGWRAFKMRWRDSTAGVD
jgi:squalene synthase HpnC